MKETKVTLIQRWKRLPRLKKIALAVIAIFTLYVVAGFLIIPPIVRGVMEKKLTQVVSRNVTVRKVRFNPLTLSTSVEGFQVQKKDETGQLFGFDSLSVNLQGLSLFKRAVILKSASISRPVINFSRIDEFTYSFSDLIPQDNNSKKSEPQAVPLLFSLNNIEIKNGDIHFFDQPKDKKHHIANLNIAVPSISNLPYAVEHYIQPAFSAVVNGTPFSLDGLAKPFADSQETDVNVDISSFNIAEYLAYLPNPTQAILSSCLLDVKGNIDFVNAQGESTLAKLSYNGQLVFKDIVISDQNEESYIHLPEIAITVAESNLLAQHVHLAKVNIASPRFTVKRMNSQEVLPLALLLPQRQEESGEFTEKNDESLSEKQDAKEFRLDIDSFSIQEGQVIFNDFSVGNFQTIISPVDVQVTGLSTKEGTTGQYEITMQTEAAEVVKSTGTFQPFPMLANGSLSIDAVKLPKYMSYIAEFISLEIDKGTLAISGAYNLSKAGDDLDVLVSKAKLSLNELNVHDQGSPILVLPEMVLTGGSVNLAEQTVNVEEIKGNLARLRIIMDKQGNVNLNSFLKSNAPETSDRTTHDKHEQPDNFKAEQGKTWGFSLAKADLKDFEVIFDDQSLDSPAKINIHNIGLTVSDISTEGAPGQVDFVASLNKAGTFKASGEVGLSPLKVKLKTDVKGLAFKPFQPYISQYLHILITGGHLSSQGVVSLISEPTKEPLISFLGNSKIENFSLIDSLSKQDLAQWKKLTISDVAFHSSPASLNIGTIGWKAPFAKIIVSDSGKLNLAELIKKRETETTQKQEEATGQPTHSESLKIQVGKFALADGRFEFVDYKIKPAYSAAVSELGGEITGLSSSPETRAVLKLEGKLNQFSPIKISGKVSPLSEEIFADLTIDVHDIDLSPASPYTGKHLGYKTDKGKLTLNLHYLVDGKEIDAQNHAFLDQFTLGEAVDSPDAANVPIHLALALLQNRKGEITLDIPVHGNLDDPEFSIGGIIAKVIFNLIAKAVTSPFALLGALIPDGDDLQYIPFQAGQVIIASEYTGKLDKIGKVLFERPGLRMDIIGKVAPQEDTEALKDLRLQNILKIIKVKETQGSFSKEKMPDLQNITVNKEESAEYIVVAYKEMLDRKDTRSKGAKMWSRFTGFVSGNTPEKKVTRDQMKEEILADINVSNEDLRLLAIQRATSVKNYLVEQGKIEPERLFLIEPQTSTASVESTASKDAAMQVDLIIK